ncbi:MAG: DUF5362 family protein [Ignavibacteriales bacterium]
MINKEELKRFSQWAGFVSVMNIIIGIVSALGGLLFLIIGALPGIFMIVMGAKLSKAKTDADQLLALPESADFTEKANLLVQHMASYLKVQGVLIIFSIFLMILMIILGILAYDLLIPYATQYFNDYITDIVTRDMVNQELGKMGLF